MFTIFGPAVSDRKTRARARYLTRGDLLQAVAHLSALTATAYAIASAWPDGVSPEKRKELLDACAPRIEFLTNIGEWK